MKTSKPRSLLVAGIALVGLSGSAFAQQSPANTGYLVDASGFIVKNNFGECWRTGYWTPAVAVAECDPALVAKEAPKVEPKAAPVAIPAPAPAARPAEVGKTTVTEKEIRLEGASFATGSSKLLPGASSKLDEAVNAVKQFPEMDLAVTGYTDSTGNAKKNLKLSQDRADAVKRYLVSKGVAANRISSKGLGAENPVADNNTASGRAKNRRVEIRYTVKEQTRVRVTP